MSDGEWFFSRQHPGVTVNSSAFRHTLAASGFDNSESLARESVQNSVDAALPGRKPRIRFHLKTLSGNEKQGFISALALNKPEWKLRGGLEFFSKSSLPELTSSETPLTLLYIDDFETLGLYGDPHRRGSQSHLRRLLLELGNDSKASDTGSSGGSFGFGGKSVFLTSGKHSIVIAYSVFDPKNDDRGAYAQLMGVGYMGDHEIGDDAFTAYPEFAKLTDSEIHRSPWIDEEAELLASKLGFAKRDRTQTGTSILIPGATVTIDAIRKAIELWWWPRLVSNQLDVELYENDVKQAVPRPKQRPELKPYIECFQAIEGGASKRVEVTGVSINGSIVGQLALRLREQAVADDDDYEDSGEWSAIEGIALIRSPRMVVQYYQGGQRRTIPRICQGVFLADPSPSVDNILRLSENAAHNIWDDKSERLLEHKGAPALVHKTLQAIRKRSQEYTKRAQPPTPPSNFHVPLLENFLVDALRSGKKGSGVRPPNPVPVHMKNVEPQMEFRDGELFLIGAPTIELEKSSSTRRAIIKVTCVPREEGRHSGTDKIPVYFEDMISQDEATDIEYILEPGKPVRVRFEAGPCDPEWSIDYRLDVEFPSDKGE